MRRLILFIIIISIAGMFSCKQTPNNVYDGDPRVFFGPKDSTRFYASWGQYDRIDSLQSYSFIYSGGKDRDTVYFLVYLMGGMVNYDRAISFEQIEKTETASRYNAIPGEDYVPFDDPEIAKHYVMPAGKAKVWIPIILLRNEKMKEKQAMLRLKIVANDHFVKPIERYEWCELNFADMLTKPAAWNTYFTGQMGKYSRVKHQFMIDISGERWDEEYTEIVRSTSNLLSTYVILFARALVKYNAEHPDDPLTDEDEVSVSFP